MKNKLKKINCNESLFLNAKEIYITNPSKTLNLINNELENYKLIYYNLSIQYKSLHNNITQYQKIIQEMKIDNTHLYNDLIEKEKHIIILNKVIEKHNIDDKIYNKSLRPKKAEDNVIERNKDFRLRTSNESDNHCFNSDKDSEKIKQNNKFNMIEENNMSKKELVSLIQSNYNCDIDKLKSITPIKPKYNNFFYKSSSRIQVNTLDNNNNNNNNNTRFCEEDIKINVYTDQVDKLDTSEWREIVKIVGFTEEEYYNIFTNKKDNLNNKYTSNYNKFSEAIDIFNTMIIDRNKQINLLNLENEKLNNENKYLYDNISMYKEEVTTLSKKVEELSNKKNKILESDNVHNKYTEYNTTIDNNCINNSTSYKLNLLNNSLSINSKKPIINNKLNSKKYKINTSKAAIHPNLSKDMFNFYRNINNCKDNYQLSDSSLISLEDCIMLSNRKDKRSKTYCKKHESSQNSRRFKINKSYSSKLFENTNIKLLSDKTNKLNSNNKDITNIRYLKDSKNNNKANLTSKNNKNYANIIYNTNNTRNNFEIITSELKQFIKHNNNINNPKYNNNSIIQNKNNKKIRLNISLNNRICNSSQKSSYKNSLNIDNINNDNKYNNKNINSSCKYNKNRYTKAENASLKEKVLLRLKELSSSKNTKIKLDFNYANNYKTDNNTEFIKIEDQLNNSNLNIIKNKHINNTIEKSYNQRIDSINLKEKALDLIKNYNTSNLCNIINNNSLEIINTRNVKNEISQKYIYSIVGEEFKSSKYDFKK